MSHKAKPRVSVDWKWARCAYQEAGSWGAIFGKQLLLGQRLESLCLQRGDVVVGDEAGKADRARVKCKFPCPAIPSWWGGGEKHPIFVRKKYHNSGNCLPKPKMPSVVSPSPWRGMMVRGHLGPTVCQRGQHSPSLCHSRN